MTLYDHKAKLYIIGLEHLNYVPAQRVIQGRRSIYDVLFKDVRRGTRKGFGQFQAEGYSLVLFSHGKHSVIIYNAK